MCWVPWVWHTVTPLWKILATPLESLLQVDSPVSFMHSDTSDLRSLILIRITPKEHTLNINITEWYFYSIVPGTFPLKSKRKWCNNNVEHQERHWGQNNNLCWNIVPKKSHNNHSHSWKLPQHRSYLGRTTQCSISKGSVSFAWSMLVSKT